MRPCMCPPVIGRTAVLHSHAHMPNGGSCMRHTPTSGRCESVRAAHPNAAGSAWKKRSNGVHMHAGGVQRLQSEADLLLPRGLAEPVWPVPLATIPRFRGSRGWLHRRCQRLQTCLAMV